MRKISYRLDAEDVQGKGAWVELKQWSHADWLKLLEENNVQGIITKSVIAWNWTGTDGLDIALPLSEDDFNALGIVERAFLQKCIVDPPAVTKN
jgi:hypothetical protein